jgi:two-component system response regulator HydG
VSEDVEKLRFPLSAEQQKRKPNGRILIIDQDPRAASLLEAVLTSQGHLVDMGRDLPEAETLLKGLQVDLVFLRVQNNEESFLQDFGTLKDSDPLVPIIVVGPVGETELAVMTTRYGAFDYLPEIFESESLAAMVDRAMGEVFRIRANTRMMRTVAESRLTSEPLGNTEVFLEAKNQILTAMQEGGLFAVVEEAGSGVREMIRLLYERSHHEEELHHVSGQDVHGVADLPFIKRGEVKGHWVLHGTQSLSRRMQGALAAWWFSLEEKPRGEDFSLILLFQQWEGKMENFKAFHPDFAAIFRVQKFLHYPTLRERREDVPLLATEALMDFTEGLTYPGFTPEAFLLLQSIPWRGNLLELRTIIGKAWVISEREPIGRSQVCAVSDDLAAAFLPEEVELYRDAESRSVLPFEDEERHILERALIATEGNVSRAAELLKIGRATLYRKIHQYDLTRYRKRSSATMAKTQ